MPETTDQADSPTDADASIDRLAAAHVRQANIRKAISDRHEQVSALETLLRQRSVIDELGTDTVNHLRQLRAEKAHALDQANDAAERFLELIGACGELVEDMDRTELGAFVLAAAAVPTLGYDRA